ncbi:MAG: GNAT family N-acetyltransferase [Phycisphaerae bacterium]
MQPTLFRLPNFRSFRCPILAIALATVASSALLTGCSTPRPAGDPWKMGYEAPKQFDTERVHMEPLAPIHAHMDYEAAMSSREHLQSTLHWGWPTAEFKVEQNKKDLERHWKEFVNNEGYAYTVLTPEGDKCLGCVYITPAMDHKLPGPVAKMAMWVRADQLESNLDDHVFQHVMRWIREDWAIETLIIKLHTDNERMLRLARQAHLKEMPGENETQVIFIWSR